MQPCKSSLCATSSCPFDCSVVSLFYKLFSGQLSKLHSCQKVLVYASLLSCTLQDICTTLLLQVFNTKQHIFVAQYFMAELRQVPYTCRQLQTLRKLWLLVPDQTYYRRNSDNIWHVHSDQEHIVIN